MSYQIIKLSLRYDWATKDIVKVKIFRPFVSYDVTVSNVANRI